MSGEKDVLIASGRTADGVPVTTTPFMTLRDWFAGQALVALADWDSPKEAARHAYKLADEMLKARQP